MPALGAGIGIPDGMANGMAGCGMADCGI